MVLADYWRRRMDYLSGYDSSEICQFARGSFVRGRFASFQSVAMPTGCCTHNFRFEFFRNSLTISTTIRRRVAQKNLFLFGSMSRTSLFHNCVPRRIFITGGHANIRRHYESARHFHEYIFFTGEIVLTSTIRSWK